jgi:hypothetical protein
MYSTSTPTRPPRIRCRQIVETDTDEIVNLLTRGFRGRLANGFRGRSRDYFACALKRLSAHPTPPGFPKYGYLLESEGAPVGVLLLLYSSVFGDGETRVRCNVSYWYVEPGFRSHAAMLVSLALKHKQVTYFNLSPAPHTVPILEAQGYARYCAGRFFAVPAFCPRSHVGRVQAVTPDICPDEDLPSSEIELLLAHAGYGCLSLVCTSASGRHPFIFRLGRVRLLPYAYLVYCRGLEDFVRFAGPLGRFLARRGFPTVVVDSDGPIPGLVGMYSGRSPKYFKGPNPPRVGDLAYSERAMFPA